MCAETSKRQCARAIKDSKQKAEGSLDLELLTSAGIIFALLIGGVIFLFVARRILRIALKLAFAMAVMFVLVVGAGVGWWRGWFETPTKNRVPAATNKRVTPGNRSR